METVHRGQSTALELGTCVWTVFELHLLTMTLRKLFKLPSFSFCKSNMRVTRVSIAQVTWSNKWENEKVFCLFCKQLIQSASGQNTGVGSLSLLQGIFPTQGLNPGLPHWRQIFLSVEPQGKPKNTEVGSLSLLLRIFLTQESNQGLLHCRQILYQLSYQGSPIKY